MNQKSNHTPTPWQMSHDLTQPIITNSHFSVAWCPITNFVDWNAAEANATFIVKACNEHEALNRVAEAAQRVADHPINKYLVQLDDALSILTAIREEAK